MTRQLRILYPGAWYHVMNRGANRQNIFLKKKHHKLFLDLLNKISSIYKIEIHAYCLMTNHYHLLIRTPEPNLPSAMKYLDSVYTKSFNKNMSRDGPLLRGRYKAILIDHDEYLLQVSRYIHLNPLEAGMIRDLEDYSWSSYPYYIGSKTKPSWLYTDFIYDYFQDDNPSIRLKKYTNAGNEKAIQDFYSSKKTRPILATDKFIEKIECKKTDSQEISYINIFSQKYAFEEVLHVVEKVTGAPIHELSKSRRGHMNIPRSIFIYLSRNAGGYKIIEITNYLSNCKYPAISLALSNFEKALLTSPNLRSLVALCEMELYALEKSYH